MRKNAAKSARSNCAGPFSEAAPYLQSLGLGVLPLGGDDGKAALKSGYPNWKRRPGTATISKWISENPNANIGVLCGLSRIVVIDVDHASLLEQMRHRFGETPIVIRTRRGYQLWYQASGNEEPADLRGREGLEVEIKAGPASIVVVPPSWNRKTGHQYRFEHGSWADLRQLPPFWDRRANLEATPKCTVQSLRPNPVGTRNLSLFNFLRLNFCFTSYEELEAEALWFNDVHQVEPEPVSKVMATARSVWDYMTKKGSQFAGGPYVHVSHSEIDALKSKAGPLFPQTLAFMVEMKRQHSGRAARGEPFVVSAHGLAEARLIPGLTNRKRIEAVRRIAEEAGVLIKIREAAREVGQFSAALYTFGRIEAESGGQNVLRVKTNTKS